METEPEKPFTFPLLTDVHWAAQDVVEYLAFSSELEAMLKSKHANLEKKIEAKLKAAPEDDRDEIIDTYAYDLHQSQSFFPAMHRESMFITLYSYLEHTLNTVCEDIGDEVGSEIRIKDLRGAGFERALLFLRRVPKFDLSKISKDVGYIRDANKLRNFVVHNGAILPGDENDRVNIFVKAEPSLSGEPGKPVGFKEEFLSAFGAKVQSLFQEIGNEMQRVMGNRT